MPQNQARVAILRTTRKKFQTIDARIYVGRTLCRAVIYRRR